MNKTLPPLINDLAPADKSYSQDSSVHYASIWISDVHLGSKDCKADYLIDFLDSISCDTLYLLGDIIDLWAMQKQFYWPESHYKVLQKIQQKVAQGTRVIYIPGNHDITFRDYVDVTVMGIEVRQFFIHRAQDGKRYLLLHGDEFDHASRYSRFVHVVGDYAYDLLLLLNRVSHFFRKLSNSPYWSLASWIKLRVNKAREAILSFEDAAIHEARRRGVDGIICGHIHQPAIRVDNNIRYCNDGDWVENCTALVENSEGEIELIHWPILSKTLNAHLLTSDLNIYEAV